MAERMSVSEMSAKITAHMDACRDQLIAVATTLDLDQLRQAAVFLGAAAHLSTQLSSDNLDNFSRILDSFAADVRMLASRR